MRDADLSLPFRGEDTNARKFICTPTHALWAEYQTQRKLYLMNTFH